MYIYKVYIHIYKYQQLEHVITNKSRTTKIYTNTLREL